MFVDARPLAQSKDAKIGAFKTSKPEWHMVMVRGEMESPKC